MASSVAALRACRYKLKEADAAVVEKPELSTYNTLVGIIHEARDLGMTDPELKMFEKRFRDTFPLKLTTLNGQEQEVTVKGIMTVDELKQELSHRVGREPQAMVLMHNTERFDNKRPLWYYGLVASTVPHGMVQLTFRQIDSFTPELNAVMQRGSSISIGLSSDSLQHNAGVQSIVKMTESFIFDLLHVALQEGILTSEEQAALAKRAACRDLPGADLVAILSALNHCAGHSCPLCVRRSDASAFRRSIGARIHDSTDNLPCAFEVHLEEKLTEFQSGVQRLIPKIGAYSCAVEYSVSLAKDLRSWVDRPVARSSPLLK